MIRKYILPLIALAGVILAIYTVIRGQRPQPIAEPVALPSRAPYGSYVAGAGIVEASTENIAIGTNVGGVVMEMSAKVGDAVKSGQPLFKIDDRQLQSDLLVRQANLAAAKANVAAQQAMVADLKNQWEMISSVSDARAVSREELDKRRYAFAVGQARLLQAQADVETAEAQVKATRIDIDRLTVTAPVDGQVFQVKIRKGEFATTGALQQPLMLIGSTDPLHVRVDIDENDAWRVSAASPAVAHVRGNQNLRTDLAFVRIEPYVVPKRSLTGDSTERVDTRVLQELYRFNRTEKFPVYVGQQMDVYIEAPSLESTSRPAQ